MNIEPATSNNNFDLIPTAPEGIVAFEPRSLFPEDIKTSSLNESLIEKVSDRLSYKLSNAKDVIGEIGIIDNMEREENALYLMNRSNAMDKAWREAIVEKYAIEPKVPQNDMSPSLKALNNLGRKIAPSFTPSKR